MNSYEFCNVGMNLKVIFLYSMKKFYGLFFNQLFPSILFTAEEKHEIYLTSLNYTKKN